MDYVGQLGYQFSQEVADVHRKLAATDCTVQSIAKSVRATNERMIALDTSLQQLQITTENESVRYMILVMSIKANAYLFSSRYGPA